MTPLQAYLKDVMDADAKRTQGEWKTKVLDHPKDYDEHTFTRALVKSSGDEIPFFANEEEDCVFIALAANKIGTLIKIIEAQNVALEFYADERNWGHRRWNNPAGCDEFTVIACDDLREKNKKTEAAHGGKRAREALALVGKLTGGAK